MSALAQISPGATRATVWRLLQAYRQLETAAKAMRRDLAASGAPLLERVAVAAVLQDLDDGITAARRWLYRDGRTGAGRSPANKGQGWPALGVASQPCAVLGRGDAAADASAAAGDVMAVGPARESLGSASAIAGDRHFSGPDGQALPGLPADDYVNSAQEVGFDG